MHSLASELAPRERVVTPLAEKIEAFWWDWLETLFPAYVRYSFAEHHELFWEHVFSIALGVRPAPYVSIWPRGGAKSTSAELATVAIGARQARRYALYVCDTQEQADDHVGNVGGLMESVAIGRHYPDLGRPAVNKFGAQKGWRRNRLRTPIFTVDAIGLDTSARGVKLDDERPDLIIFDDIDRETDTPATTAKKILQITQKILPAGAEDVAVIGVQNMIIPDGVFGQLADDRAEFLSDRIVSGPIPALREMTYEQRTGDNGRTYYHITGGIPTWEGQGLERCQNMVKDMGITAFRRECQHESMELPGGMFSHLEWTRVEWKAVPSLVLVRVWVDPAVTATDDSDSMGIQADGLGEDGKIYRLYSWEQVTTPEDAIRRAILKALDLFADAVGVETDQGGDTWESVYYRVWEQLVADEEYPQITAETLMPSYLSAKAGEGHGSKRHRAQQMLTDYETGGIVHVIGTHNVLERALYRFPKTKPFDLTDAAYWSWLDLRGGISEGAYL